MMVAGIECGAKNTKSIIPKDGEAIYFLISLKAFISPFVEAS